MCLKYFLILNVMLSIKTQNVKSDAEVIVGPRESSVFDRGLCVQQTNKNDILNNYKSYYANTNDRRVLTNALGFLDSSNQNSLTEALTFAQKFSLLSPFRLEIRRTGVQKYEISGIFWLETNRKWIQSLSKAVKTDLKIVPVVTFVDWKSRDFLALATSYKEIVKLTTELLDVCEKNKLDGLILDIWSEFYSKIPTNLLVMIVQEISVRLRLELKLALLLIPPVYANKDVITVDVFENLTDYLNYIILQVYDYSSGWKPGPSSPIVSTEEFIKYLTPDPLIRRGSILMGVQFFGNDFSPRVATKITKEKYIALLEDYSGELEFDDEAMEHHFEIMRPDGKHSIYYPTLYSINSRVRLANKLGVGVAIADLGEGLDYFYDVL